MERRLQWPGVVSRAIRQTFAPRVFDHLAEARKVDEYYDAIVDKLIETQGGLYERQREWIETERRTAHDEITRRALAIDGLRKR